MNDKITFAIIVTLVGLSCSSEYPEGYWERLDSFEKNWAHCYNERFNFPYENTVLENEYLQCKLDDEDILINNNRTGMDGTVSYEIGYSTFSPNLFIENSSPIVRRLNIGFITFAFNKKIAIVVDYSADSLNYTIQNTFNQNIINCSSNFIYNSPRFDVGTGCSPNGAVLFSSFYSLRETQIINIDSFSYFLENNKWHYHLEYSFDELEVTNEVWNADKKIDIRGKKRKNNVFVENLLLKDMICVIEFELPED